PPNDGSRVFRILELAAIPGERCRNCSFYATLIFTVLCNRASFGDGARLECCSDAIGLKGHKKTDRRRALVKKALREAWGHLKTGSNGPVFLLPRPIPHARH